VQSLAKTDHAYDYSKGGFPKWCSTRYNITNYRLTWFFHCIYALQCYKAKRNSWIHVSSKIKSTVSCFNAYPFQKFHKFFLITFWAISLTNKHTNNQANWDKNITSFLFEGKDIEFCRYKYTGQIMIPTHQQHTWNTVPDPWTTFLCKGSDSIPSLADGEINVNVSAKLVEPLDKAVSPRYVMTPLITYNLINSCGMKPCSANSLKFYYSQKCYTFYTAIYVIICKHVAEHCKMSEQ